MISNRVVNRNGVVSSSWYPCTTSGWYWHCDTHDTHGNADNEQEARIVSRAHVKYHTGEECSVVISHVED